MMDGELYSKLRSLITARLIIGSTLLLGAALPLEISQIYSSSRFLFRLVTLILILSIVYSGLLNRVRNVVLFAYIQLIGDVFLETFIILGTGGIESPFSILYVITIIVASYLIPRLGAWFTAVFVSFIYGFYVLSQYQGWTLFMQKTGNWVYLPAPSIAVTTIVVNLAGFSLTAFLANHLSERIRKIDVLLRNRDVQYTSLRVLNERIINEISTGLITTTKDGVCLFINPAATKMLGLSEINRANLHLEKIFPDYFVTSILGFSESEVGKNQKIYFQKAVEHQTRWFEIEISSLPLVQPDPAGIMLIFKDITDQKQLEQTRRKAERWSAIAEISAGMAHEIRNPLASISGSIEILKEQLDLSNIESRLMNIIIRESDRLNKLISDFLELAKPKRPDFSLVNIHSVINETVMLMQQSSEWKPEIEVIKEYETDELMVEMDGNQFTQVIWNIVKNAIEAVEKEGKIVVRTQLITVVDMDPSRPESDRMPKIPYAKISLSDNGVGMTLEMQEKIFEPFATFKRKGVGIGLAIVYRIVENHSGHIYVESSPGIGTVFCIRFPLRQTGLTPEKIDSEVLG